MKELVLIFYGCEILAKMTLNQDTAFPHPEAFDTLYHSIQKKERSIEEPSMQLLLSLSMLQEAIALNQERQIKAN